jgi:hypothetical protein
VTGLVSLRRRHTSSIVYLRLNIDGLDSDSAGSVIRFLLNLGLSLILSSKKITHFDFLASPEL